MLKMKGFLKFFHFKANSVLSPIIFNDTKYVIDINPISTRKQHLIKTQRTTSKSLFAFFLVYQYVNYVISSSNNVNVYMPYTELDT